MIANKTEIIDSLEGAGDHSKMFINNIHNF